MPLSQILLGNISFQLMSPLYSMFPFDLILCWVIFLPSPSHSFISQYDYMLSNQRDSHASEPMCNISVVWSVCSAPGNLSNSEPFHNTSHPCVFRHGLNFPNWIASINQQMHVRHSHSASYNHHVTSCIFHLFVMHYLIKSESVTVMAA